MASIKTYIKVFYLLWLCDSFVPLHVDIAYVYCPSVLIFIYVVQTNMKNNAWITVNNDFWSRVRWFANENLWQITSRVTLKKLLFTVTKVLFYFLHAVYVSNTQFRQKSSIVHFAVVAKEDLFWLSIVTSPQLICDGTRTRGISIVTSYSPIVLAREIGANVVFTSE